MRGGRKTNNGTVYRNGSRELVKAAYSSGNGTGADGSGMVCRACAMAARRAGAWRVNGKTVAAAGISRWWQVAVNGEPAVNNARWCVCVAAGMVQCSNGAQAACAPKPAVFHPQNVRETVVVKKTVRQARWCGVYGPVTHKAKTAAGGGGGVDGNQNANW